MTELQSDRKTEQSPFKTYMRLLGYMKDLVLLFIVSIVGFGIYAASNPMLAKLNGLVIQAIEQKNSGARWELPVFAIGIFVVRGFGSFLGTYFSAYVSARMMNNIRAVVFEHITRLPVSYFHQQNEGTIMQRVTGSINLMSQSLTDSVRTMMREGLTVIALLGYVFYLNWQLSLIFLAVAPLMALVVSYTSRRFRAITRKNEGRNANLLQITREMISGHEVMRVFNGQRYENARYHETLEKSFKDLMKVRKIASLSTPVMQLLVAAALAGMIFLLLMPNILSGHTTADLVGYLTAVALVPKSMKQLSGLGVALQRGVVGAQLIFELLDTPVEKDEGKIEIEHASGAISASHVKFRYRDDQPYVLDDISFEIKPGEMVAMVGRSGGGKSTLATLLQRFYDVDEGSIAIDGIDLRDYKVENLRKHISLVSQNLVLFNDTIRNNIAYGAMNGCSDEEILAAAGKAHALEIIQQQSHGLDTVIGDNGLQLSGGQRQRIAIARAFLKNAPILILDEATSALDNESEQMIQQALNEVMQGRTTIVIAHRLSTIERADKILVVSNGHIVEQGSHAELLQRNGVYKSLYTAKEF
jgi:subfamily B ATP-binding cassette protein MsbA